MQSNDTHISSEEILVHKIKVPSAAAVGGRQYLVDPLASV